MHYWFFGGFPVLLSMLVWLYFTNKRSLLSVLILLEILTFTTLLSFYVPLMYMYSSMSYFLVLFCFSAVGAALGLSMLITTTRLSGTDLIKSAFYWKNFVFWSY